MVLHLALSLITWVPCQAALLRTESSQRAAAGVGLRAQVGYMVQDMLRSKHTTSRRIATRMHKRMKLSEALPALEGKLPKDVLSLVRSASKAHSASYFSETSLRKGRIYLNNMMYDAWLELDQIEVDCKEFEESSRIVFRPRAVGVRGSDRGWERRDTARLL